MDRLAVLAQQHYAAHLPRALAAIPAGQRTAFFEGLATQANQQIAELEDGQAPPGETFQARMGRLAEARSAAEAQVIREMLPSPEAVAAEAAMTPEQVEHGSAEPMVADPTAAELDAAVAAFWTAQQETAPAETGETETAPTP
jgi:hypothetical protein